MSGYESSTLSTASDILKPMMSSSKASGFSKVSSILCTNALVAVRSTNVSRPKASKSRSIASQAMRFSVKLAIGVYSINRVRFVSNRISSLILTTISTTFAIPVVASAISAMASIA